MKMTTAKRDVKLASNNAAETRKSNDVPHQKTAYSWLSYVLADMMDEIAKGQDYYAIVGATKDRTALVFTLVHGGDRESVYAETFAELCTKLQQFV